MKKEEFMKYMKDIENMYSFMGDLDDLFKKYDMRDNQMFNYPLLDDCIELLEKLLGLETDSVGYTTLSWYIFENNFGKGDNKMWLGEEEIPIKTLDDLWEQILREKGE